MMLLPPTKKHTESMSVDERRQCSKKKERLSSMLNVRSNKCEPRKHRPLERISGWDYDEEVAEGF